MIIHIGIAGGLFEVKQEEMKSRLEASPTGE